eukprot:scaffold55908_cov32-Tisochrysis_lutea.AAC.2
MLRYNGPSHRERHSQALTSTIVDHTVEQKRLHTRVGHVAKELAAISNAATVEGVDQPSIDHAKMRIALEIMSLVCGEIVEDITCPIPPKAQLIKSNEWVGLGQVALGSAFWLGASS